MADTAARSPLHSAEPSLLVGREREQAALRDRLAAALAGRGSLVLIGGEAGIGKTALAEALLRDAETQGATVLVGRCYDLSETPPYGPWRELVARLPADHDRSPLPAPLGQGEAPASQAALFARVHDVFTTLAAGRPLVLLLDDLHWADPASLDLLRFLARQLAALPLLLLVTYRADELTRRHPLYQLLPLLVREARAAQLDLRALPDAAVRDLVRARYALPEADEQRLARYLRERAEGHPLFASELLRTLEGEGVLDRGDGGWRLGDLGGLRVPRLLRQVIEGRLDRLGEADQRLLAVAAVIGQEVPLALWAAVAEADEEDLLETVERAAGARLVEPTGEGFRFAHALIREALYEGTLPLRRRGWHRRAGEALAASANPDPDAVAHHFRQAGDPRAVEWLVRAGERARRAYAWLTAAERLEAAAALLAGNDARAGERGWLLLKVAHMRRYADPPGAIAQADEAARLAAAAGDPALAAYSRLGQGLYRYFAGQVREGLAHLAAATDALEALPQAENDRMLALFGGLPSRGTLIGALAEAGRLAEARAMGERYLARAGAPAPGADTGASPYGDGWLGLGLAYALLGRPAEAGQAFAQARATFQVAEHHAMLAYAGALELEAVALAYQPDRVAERRQLASEVERAAARAGGAGASVPLRAVCLPLLALEGRWAEARALGLAALAVGPRTYLARIALRALGPLAHVRGEADLAWEVVRSLLPGGPDTAPGDTIYLHAAAAQSVAAALAIDAGDLPTARAWLEVSDRWLAWSGAVLGRAEGQLGWAAYHRAVGDLALAVEHAERALAHATEPRQPLALLAAHRLLGELKTAAGRHAGVQAHLDQALALAEACAAPYERALTLLAAAELHAASGARDEARRALDEARALLTPLEAVPALARAEALAARLAAAATTSPAYPAGLTAREVEVLRLVAAGLTDAEVAERLYLSPRTVTTHLSHIYNKLGVSTRLAATRFALEHRLA